MNKIKNIINKKLYFKKENDINLNSNDSNNVDADFVTKHDYHANLKDLRLILKIWALFSSSNGVPNLARTTFLRLRLLYGSCYLVCLGYSIYLSIQLIQQYCSYQTSISSQIIYESPTYFPAVDICNLSPYGTQNAMNLLSEIITTNNLTFVKKENAKAFTDSLMYELILKIKDLNSAENISISKYSPDIEDMLISCTFQGEKCAPSDFIPIENFYYGNCFRFNGGNNQFGNSYNVKQSFQAGPQYGLQIEIDTGDPNLSKFTSYKSGLKVIVHNQSDVAIFPEEDGINIPTGFYTDISVSRTFNNELSEPYNYCLDFYTNPRVVPNDFLSLMNKRFGPNGYNQKYCLKLCMQKYLNDKCDCIDLSLPFYTNSTTFCINKNQTTCIARTKILFFDTGANDDCQNLCPIDCSINIIDTSISIATFTSKWNALLMKNNASHGQINKDFLKRYLILNVFYEDLSYTLKSQSPTNNLNNLMSNIGGTMGIFIGISLLSCVECIEIFYVLIAYFISRNKKQFVKKYNYFEKK